LACRCRSRLSLSRLDGFIGAEFRPPTRLPRR
jgi:hypothetical protein